MSEGKRTPVLGDHKRVKSKLVTPFNDAFGQLKELAKQNRKDAKAGPERRPSPLPREKAPGGDDEAAMFLAHVGEVVPVRKGRTGTLPPLHRPPKPSLSAP